METFRIKATPGEGCCILAMYGEADLAVAGDIIELGTISLCEDSTRKLIIDLGGLTFLDSSGIGALIHLRNLAMASHKELALVHVPARVHQVLNIAGLGHHFTIQPDGVVMTEASRDQRPPNRAEPKPYDPGRAVSIEGGAMLHDPQVPGRHHRHRLKPMVQPR